MNPYTGRIEAVADLMAETYEIVFFEYCWMNCPNETTEFPELVHRIQD